MSEATDTCVPPRHMRISDNPIDAGIFFDIGVLDNLKMSAFMITEGDTALAARAKYLIFNEMSDDIK